MPALVHYAPTYPSLTKPVQADASIASNGLVTGSIVFLAPPTTAQYLINQPISSELFDSLSGIRLQGLFVETRTLEKKNGLSLLRLSVVGAVNPPALDLTKTVTQKSFSKSVEIVGEETQTASISFDYYAETISVSTVATIGQQFPIDSPDPAGGEIWNLRYTPIESIAGPGFAPANINPFAYYGVESRLIRNETRERRGSVVTITKSTEFVYE